MNSFTFYNPVRIIFGPGEMDQLGRETASIGTRVLLVEAREDGHLAKTGVYERARSLLEAAGVQVFELKGVLPNPRLSLVKKGASICRENKVDAVIAVGGGSVIDTAKAVAVAALDDGDVWDFFLLKRKAKGALPLGVVVTLSATGSEMNVNSVITNEATNQKYAIHYPFSFPRFSIIDPKLHVSIPFHHIAYGAYDIFSHVLEGYFDDCPDTPLQDRLGEGILITTMESVERIRKNPDDLGARCNLAWSATLALNGLHDAGRGNQPYDAHTIEHELGARYDVSHGAGLAIVQPVWLQHGARENPAKFVQFAQRVFGICPDGKTDKEVGQEGINALRSWARGIGCPITLREIDVPRDDLRGLAEDIVKNPEGRELDSEKVYAVLLDCYED
ncbi:MAG TPA: iron-containing alcohol dehydrogenase [Atribacteraceae bacterium]|nr:iron-containing alcohol dehydrogenase [Atribacteraceae bacterium]